jgi:hypothetical protein
MDHNNKELTMKSLKQIYESAYQLTTSRSRISANVPLELVAELPDCNVQREYHSRTKRMIPHFNKQAESVYDLTVFNVKNALNVVINDKEYPVAKGLQKGDCHTRTEAWTKHDPKFKPPFVNVKFVDIETAEQFLTEYYSYDSGEATEKTTHKITGALRLMDIDMRSSRGKKGTFGESVRYAYPHGKAWVAEMIGYFKSELPIVDKYVMQCDSKELRGQTSTLVSAFLIALKMYGKPAEQKQQLISMMKKLSTIKADNWQLQHNPNNDDATRFDGAQLIIREAINPQFTIGGTKGADFVNTLDFYLYCINNWMQGKFLKQVKPELFKGCYDDAMDIIEAL